jgi:hypothetical protein
MLNTLNPGSWFLILGSWFLALDSWFYILFNTRNPHISGIF